MHYLFMNEFLSIMGNKFLIYSLVCCLLTTAFRVLGYSSSSQNSEHINRVISKVKTEYFDGIGRQNANRIVIENRQLGTRDWWYNQTDSDPWIEGFTDSFSYVPGDVISFKLTSAELSSSRSQILVDDTDIIDVKIYRLGYYNGDGGRLIGSVKYLNKLSKYQPHCLFENFSRMIDCDNWGVSIQWNIPTSSISGIYVALPSFQKNGIQLLGSYVPFVIRQDFDKQLFGSDILLKTADTTWVAYNSYGGWNLYRGNNSVSFGSRASKVSYNRPFANRLPSRFHKTKNKLSHRGAFENFLFGSEYPLLFWLEKHGYDVSYASCADVEIMYSTPNILSPQNYKLLISMGHDEYYSQTLRDSFVTARNRGINLAFFTGNELFWRLRWESANRKKSDSYLSSSSGGSLLPHISSSGNSRSKQRERVIRVLSNGIYPLIGINSVNLSESNNENSTKLTINIRPYRVFICAKETMTLYPTPYSDQLRYRNVQREWTGTFIDPIHRPPQPENAITGNTSIHAYIKMHTYYIHVTYVTYSQINSYIHAYIHIHK